MHAAGSLGPNSTKEFEITIVYRMSAHLAPLSVTKFVLLCM